MFNNNSREENSPISVGHPSVKSLLDGVGCAQSELFFHLGPYSSNHASFVFLSYSINYENTTQLIISFPSPQVPDCSFSPKLLFLALFNKQPHEIFISASCPPVSIFVLAPGNRRLSQRSLPHCLILTFQFLGDSGSILGT